MAIEFNANIKLLLGGVYKGDSNWNKVASDIDHCFKIYYIETGKANLLGQNDSFLLEEGSLYFINGYVLASQCCMERLKIRWLHFQPQSVYFDHVLKSAPCVVSLDEIVLQHLKAFPIDLEKFFLNEEDTAVHRIHQVEIIAFVHLCIAAVFRSIDKRLLTETVDLARLMPALEYITRHFSAAISLKDMAASCYLSSSHFHRVFSAAFGISPFNYVKKLRMEEAVRQLVYTQKPVKQIAWDTGYEDESYFSRTFSMVYNTSPGKFRRGHQVSQP